jgi:fibronectin type 3 domain-containing protein
MEKKGKLLHFCLFLTALFLLLNGCTWVDDDEDNGSGSSSVTVTVSPSSITLAKGTVRQFSATVSNGYSSVTWSVEGNSSPETAISREGVLSVAGNEGARTLTVKATWSSYGETASGTAKVTVAAETEIPSNLKISKPGKTGINLSWSAVTNASSYKVYRSINGKDYSHLGDVSAASYMDTAVTAGSSYYYAVSAVVKGLETGKSTAVFGFAMEYFALPAIGDKRLVPIKTGEKHYYRFPVISGGSYTITWEDGSSQNADYYVQCTAWQNDGTQIMNRQSSGYTSPKVFTADSAGYITVEVGNWSSSASHNYMAYCLRKEGETDSGVAALPPAPVAHIKATAPVPSSITLGWDPVPAAVSYNIYRAPTKDAAPGLLGVSNVSSYADTTVAAGISYYYTVAPVNADGKEGARVERTFAYAVTHYALPAYSSSQLVSLPAGSKHYYRLAVSAGQDVILTWENGSSQNADYYVQCTAWQNDGTQIMNRQSSGYTSPKAFTADSAGYITVEVGNWSSSASYDYQIYYY